MCNVADLSCKSKIFFTHLFSSSPTQGLEVGLEVGWNSVYVPVFMLTPQITLLLHIKYYSNIIQYALPSLTLISMLMSQ